MAGWSRPANNRHRRRHDELCQGRGRAQLYAAYKDNDSLAYGLGLFVPWDTKLDYRADWGGRYNLQKVQSAHAALARPNDTALPTGGKYATTLGDYRYLYKRYRTDRRLQNLHERFAFVAVWDDHEFGDDCWQDRETYDNGTLHRQSTPPESGMSTATLRAMPSCRSARPS